MKKPVFLLCLTILLTVGCAKSPRDKFVDICNRDKSTNEEELKACPCIADSLEKNLKPEKYQKLVEIMGAKENNAILDPELASDRDIMAGLFRAALACTG